MPEQTVELPGSPGELLRPARDPALRRAQIMVLIAAFLGWMFDGLEMGISPLIARPALASLLHTTVERDIAHWQQIIDAFFLWGAACGGLVFGWLGDKIGRVKAMSVSILVYSLVTGSLYFVQTPWQMAGLRFVAAIGMGGEWALGVALVMEVWDARHRPLLAGMIGAAANVGFLLMGVVGVIVPINQSNWRYIVILGAAPALLMIFVQLFVPESHKWKESQKVAPSKPIKELVGDPKLAKRALLAICFSSVSLLVTWGAVQKIPSWVRGLTDNKHAAGYVQMLSAGGAIAGCMLTPWFSAVFKRRTIYFLLCLLSMISCECLFLGFTHLNLGFILLTFVVGAFSAAFYGWLPLYLPELFPTRVRATAQGIAYNFGRIGAGAGAIWGGMIGKSYAQQGAIVSSIYIVGMAIIWLAPETKGKPLPE
jgi:MFS family permease